MVYRFYRNWKKIIRFSAQYFAIAVRFVKKVEYYSYNYKDKYKYSNLMTLVIYISYLFIIWQSTLSNLRSNLYVNNSLHNKSPKDRLTVRSYSTKRQITVNTCTDLVIWGTHLGSTVNYGRFTKLVREMIVLPPYQESIVVGLLLSDGWLSLTRSNTVSNARLGFKQSLEKFEYVWKVFNDLSHYCQKYPTFYLNHRAGKVYPGITIATRALPCFTSLHNIFYIDNKKVIPYNIYDILTPVALAHLIMGDGTYRQGGLRLCTDSYTITDVVRLMNVLIVRYRLKVTLHTDRGMYRIYLSKSSMPILISVVKPYMVASMLYKLGI